MLYISTRGEAPAILRDLARLMPATAGVRRFGAAALDLAYVAAGRFEGFWERGLHEWDIAAVIILVREAGGLVDGIERDTDPMQTGSLICANEPIFDSFAKVLREA